jgi:hypothetical protein
MVNNIIETDVQTKLYLAYLLLEPTFSYNHEKKSCMAKIKVLRKHKYERMKSIGIHW